MAEKDVGIGWGTLPGELEEWDCPGCEAVSQVIDWKQESGIVNQRRMDGRKCPKCGFLMTTIGTTNASLIARATRRSPKPGHPPHPPHGGQAAHA